MEISFDSLRACPLFFGIAEPELPELLERLEADARSYKKGETVFWEGAKVDAVGIILWPCSMLFTSD